MKILFLSRLFYPHIGGVEKHVAEISKVLINKGHDVTIVTEKYDTSLPDKETINRIKILRIDHGRDNWFEKFKIWREIWSNRDLIKEAAVIHAHDVFFWYLPFRFIFPSKKVFTTFHGYEGNAIPGIKSKTMHKLAEKLSFGNISVGRFLGKWYGTKSDSIIYGGISSSVNLKNKNQDFKNNKILFLGRLEEETGIMVYLESLKLLKDKGYDFELTVLGDGHLRKDAERFSRKNKLGVSFKGFIKNTEPFLKSSYIVFVSRYLGILEALSFGKPVFAVYNNKIKKDYLTMTPFAEEIFISRNSSDLSSQLVSFLKKPQNLSDSWIKNQTWEKISETYLKLWAEN